MRLDSETIETLKQVTVSGNQTTMPQLDRKLYVKVNQALECLGGKWNRAAKAHVWDCDPGDPIADAVLTGEVRDWRKELQYFPTPSSTAHWLADQARVMGGKTILEPSAGDGRLIKACVDCATGMDNLRKVVAVEVNPQLVAKLTEFRQKLLYANDGNFVIHQGDFLTLNGELGQFNCIVMNPPFSKGQDIAHVQHAFKMLKPGGRLAAITSPGWTFRTDKKHGAFREWTHAVGAEVHHLPPGTFKESGTDVRTVALVIHN